MTNNLNLPQLAQSQNNKYVTINDQSAALDAAITAQFIVEVDDTNAVSVGETDLNRLNVLQLNAAATAPTGTVTVNLAATQRGAFAVFNNLSVPASVQVSGGQTATAPSVAAGASVLVTLDGSDVRLVAGGGGATSLDDLDDVDTATSGSSGGDTLQFDGTKYVPKPRSLDIAFYKPKKPAASATVLQFVAQKAFTLPSGLSGSQGFAGTAPSDGDKTFDVQKNGSSVGGVTFATGSQTASFSMSTSTSFATGDRLLVVAPGTQDSTLADVSISFQGTKQ